MSPAILNELERDASAETGAQFVALVSRYFAETRSASGPVSPTRDHAAAARAFDEPLPAHGHPLPAILERVERDIVAGANRLSHPMYAGHQVSAPLPAAVWTEMVTAALNNSIAVREMSPTLTALERRVIRWMCGLAGFGQESGGTFTSGGTEATFSALLAARAALLPDSWDHGLGVDLPVVLCGEHAHYAVTRAVAQLGLGMRRAIPVPSRDHRMDTAALRTLLARERSAGRAVMAVVATAGSTATGSFDDLEAVADACDEHGTWLHVDAAHGASALLSMKHRHRLHGLSRARSLAWDPHKMMLLPLAAGMVLVRDERDLDRAYSQNAPYLFHGAEESPDQGVRSFQCSRRGDALKAWVALQRYGAHGIGELYDQLCARAMAMREILLGHGGFDVLHTPESNILCFRWRGSGALSDDVLDTMNAKLRERYNASGEGWITTTVLDGRRVLRVTIMNPRTEVAHLERLVSGLARAATEPTA